MTLVRVEAGTFTQGSPPGEARRGADETQREVVLTRAFYIGKFPVTHREFRRFVEETRFRTEAEIGTSGGYGWDGTKLVQRRDFTWRNPGFAQSDEHPVVLVTYPDAEAFANWLSRKSRRKFVLPTEAQWEYACRAGTATAFPSGDSPEGAETIVWHNGNSPAGTQPVGRKAPNPWGIHDMLGQAWEWCQDFYGPYAPGRVVDPLATSPGPGERPRRVLRGGSWLKDLSSCRSATRYRNDPKSRNADNGFRLVTLDPPAISAAPTRSHAAPAPEPKLEREDPIVVPANEHVPSAAPPTHDRAPSPRPRSLNPLSIFFWVLLAVVLAKVVSAILKRTTLTATGVESLRGSFEGTPLRPEESARRPAGALATRVVDDGFWIQSDELPAGTLLVCRYTAAEGSKELNVHFEPGREGHFIFTGSRPRAVSVVVAGRGTAAGMLLSDPPIGEVPPRDDADDDRRFRGFPPAY